MKRFIVLILVCLIMSGCSSSIYYDSAIVTDVRKNEIFIEFSDGNLFTFEGDGYIAGDFVHVKFDNNGTKTRIDDIILAVTDPLFR